MKNSEIISGINYVLSDVSHRFTALERYFSNANVSSDDVARIGVLPDLIRRLSLIIQNENYYDEYENLIILLHQIEEHSLHFRNSCKGGDSLAIFPLINYLIDSAKTAINYLVSQKSILLNESFFSSQSFVSFRNAIEGLSANFLALSGRVDHFDKERSILKDEVDGVRNFVDYSIKNVNIDNEGKVKDFLRRQEDWFEDAHSKLSEGAGQAIQLFRESLRVEILKAHKEAEDLKNLVGALSGEAMASSHLESAINENKLADKYRLFSLLVVALMIISVLIYTFKFADVSNFSVLAIKLSIAFLMLIPAGYLARESARHRDVSEYRRHIGINLLAMRVYMADMDNSEKVKFKKEMADKLFTNYKYSENGKTLDSFAEIVSAAISKK